MTKEIQLTQGFVTLGVLLRRNPRTLVRGYRFRGISGFVRKSWVCLAYSPLSGAVVPVQALYTLASRMSIATLLVACAIFNKSPQAQSLCRL